MTDKKLNIHSIFFSLQGEALYSGRPAVFIRLSGCSLNCSFCDTDHITGAKEWEDDDIVKEVLRWPQTDLVVITGGEPFMQDFSVLCSKLFLYDKIIQIETNGTILPNWYHDIAKLRQAHISIVCSPKNMDVAKQMVPYVEAFKYVVKAGDLHEGSGLPIGVFNALNYAGQWIIPKQVYLQPMDEQSHDKNAANLQAAIASCLQHGYCLSIQIQKIIGCE